MRDRLDAIKLPFVEKELQRHKDIVDDLIETGRRSLDSGEPEMCEELHLFGRRVKIELL